MLGDGARRSGDVSSIIGWDVGGAHLKGARAENGRIVNVVQLPGRLWLGLSELEDALAEARATLGEADRHAATMTGELADVFASRAEGVASLAAMLSRLLSPLVLYAGRAGFIDPQAAAAHAIDVASANWHASAALAGRHVPEALFVDMGSTTTDLVPIRGGRVNAAGYTDAQRLACGELVYTGLARGFVMALAARAPFAGCWTPLACEHFATTADIYRLLGELPDGADLLPAADGRDKSAAASRARLARMVGCDAADASDAAWHDLAAYFAEAQLRQLVDAAMLLVSREAVAADATLVAAGVGRHVIARLAQRLGRGCVDFAELLGEDAPPRLSDCAPAIAVALLAGQSA